MASSLVAGFTEVLWASCWKICESRLKNADFSITGMIEMQNIFLWIGYIDIWTAFAPKIYAAYHDTFSFFVVVEASGTWHPGLLQWRPLFVDSQGQVVRSQNRTKCVKYVWLSYPTWPSRWVLCISMQWLRLKGCHVACDEWTSGEICSLQHMWVTGSVMWAAAIDESLKFGVQGASATNWFPRVNGARDNGIRL